MFQWHNERAAGLVAYAPAHGLDPGSVAAQEGYFAEEAEARLPGWKSVSDLSSAAYIGHAYEGYGDNSTGTRVANAAHWLAMYDAQQYAGEGETHHTHVYLDGKKITSVVERNTVKKNRQVYGPSKHDGLAGLVPVDSGLQWDR
jgi:hypothetical protein